ncbi:(2Fe-2S)-binding protein [Chitinophaga japonensis]|uniref:Isoquinoline 1-oxidoreductase alpha subunit n=1 Tax=Chitinophaga japonensis TaxID=104662 RepID=A0A562T4Z7_CHIJA|nr:(2Fe-2S)-binding protein [Chitinophaga japonensis]TWI88605.1 isoquinoline 1-oxidoreductase alpha subunit [Chitinophaga japonensis]
MPTFNFNINGAMRQFEVDADMPVLWLLRDYAGLTGTRYGCGIAQCGACTIHLDGKAVRSCTVTCAAAAGKKILTIEGLSPDGSHPLQQAWIQEDVPQCGYCQAGQIMSAAALLNTNASPSDDAIHTAMAGNICRCGTYVRIRKAIKTAIALQAKTSSL